MSNKTNKTHTTEVTATIDQTNQDFMLSLLIVSLTINAFVLIGWIALQVTSVYDAEVAAFLFTR